MNNFFIFECPFCGYQSKYDEDMEGVAINCPSCKTEIVPTRKPKGTRKKPLALSKLNSIQSDEEEDDDDGTFKKPMISAIFDCLGILNFILFIVMLFLVKEEMLLIVGSSLLASSLFSFFFANITHGISKIAYNSSRIVKLLERHRE